MKLTTIMLVLLFASQADTPSVRYQHGRHAHFLRHRVVLQTQAVYLTTLLRNFYRVEQRYATRTI